MGAACDSGQSLGKGRTAGLPPRAVPWDSGQGYLAASYGKVGSSLNPETPYLGLGRCEEETLPSPVRCWLPGLGRFMICFASSWPWQERLLGTRRGLCRGRETQGAGPPQQGSRHRPIPPTAGAGWGSGAGCAWGLGSCLLWEAGGSGASPAHTARSVLGPERGNGWGAALLGAGAGRLGQAGGPWPWMPGRDSS